MAEGPGFELDTLTLALDRVLGVALGCGAGVVVSLTVFPARAVSAAIETAGRVAALLARQMQILQKKSHRFAANMAPSQRRCARISCGLETWRKRPSMSGAEEPRAIPARRACCGHYGGYATIRTCCGGRAVISALTHCRPALPRLGARPPKAPPKPCAVLNAFLPAGKFPKISIRSPPPCAPISTPWRTSGKAQKRPRFRPPPFGACSGSGSRWISSGEISVT